MSEKIYKQIIEDSPMPYLHIKVIKDGLGNFKAIEIKDFNIAYEKMFLTDLRIRRGELVDIEDCKDKIRYKILDRVGKNKKYTIAAYEEKLGEYLNIDIYKAYEDEYHLRVNKINKQNIELSSALKNSPLLVWIKDRSGRFIDANQKKLNLLNKTYNEVIGKTNYEIFEKETAEYIKSKDNEVLKNNKLIIYEDIFEKSKNEYGYHEVLKWPYMNEDETITLGTIGIAIDNTENIKLRKELEEVEKRFLEITNNIQDVIIILDDKKAHYVNPAFEKVFDIKPDEIYKDISTWKDCWDDIVFEEEPKPFSSKDTFTVIHKAVKLGQEDKWIWGKFVPIFDEDGNVTKRIGILSDITKNKNAEKELYNTKMEFFANLSHELRTPINLILSSLQVIDLKMDKLDDEFSEYFNKYIGIINQNGHRLLKLVNNLIDTTKLESGYFGHNPENKDIIRCVEDICMSVSSFVSDNKLEIIFDTDLEEKVISFDSDNIERIILNLLSNAIKFNKPKGKINVNISCNDDVKISIRDSGIGIPDEKLQDIFKRFGQSKNTFRREKEGSGMGLFLVKSIVEMHNGTIEVNSVVGEGSEFIITLPDMLTDKNGASDFKQLSRSNNKNKMMIELSDIYI